jgi:import inner membrane translocase subunit TIM16
MTLDEAHLILNTKKEEELERVLRVRVVFRISCVSQFSLYIYVIGLTRSLTPQNYEHLFKMNSPASPSSSETPTPRPTAGKQPTIPSHSHYLQSKVVRARERIEAELKIAQEDAAAPATHEAPGSTPPPPSEGGTGPGSKPS